MAHREPNIPPLDASLQNQATLLYSDQQLDEYDQHQRANPNPNPNPYPYSYWQQEQPLADYPPETTQRGYLQQDLALQPYSQQQQQQQHPSQDNAQNTPLAYVTEMYPMPGPPGGIQLQEVGQELRSQSQSQPYAPQTQVNSPHDYSAYTSNPSYLPHLSYPPHLATAANSHQNMQQQSNSRRVKQITATTIQPSETIDSDTYHNNNRNHRRDEPDCPEFCECLCLCCEMLNCISTFID